MNKNTDKNVDKNKDIDTEKNLDIISECSNTYTVVSEKETLPPSPPKCKSSAGNVTAKQLTSKKYQRKASDSYIKDKDSITEQVSFETITCYCLEANQNIIDIPD